MSSAPPPSPQEIARDATWLVQAIDPQAGLARLIRMSAEDYRSASFLDDRMLQAPIDARLAPIALVEEAAQLAKRDDARWIFHIGHVGSTLIARLLGELEKVLSVREPRMLRDLVVAPKLAGPAQRLLSRTVTDDQVALVKATSFVSEIAPTLIGQDGSTLFLTATPRNYIASILAGENSMKELHALAPSRAQRIAERVPGLPQPRSDADLAAMAWACEATALEAAAEALPHASIAWVDFDRWLDDPDLAPIAEAMALPAQPAELAALKQSPLLSRYSKALEYEYSAGLRRDLIAEAGAHFAAEIDSALAMLGHAAETSPLLKRSLGRGGE